MDRIRRLASCGLGVFALALPVSARAHGSMDLNLSGVYVPVGVNLGAGLRQDGADGFLLGGEASLVRFWADSLAFFGGYVDYLHDFGAKTHRLSIGPEIGMLFAGIDAGPVLELGGGQTELGARARLFGSIAFFTIYVGEACRLTTPEARFTTELGVLIKIPFGIASCSRNHCNWGHW